MTPRIGDRFNQFGDDMRRRRLVGIAHPEIDDVFTGSSRLGLHVVHFIEDVGRQSLYAVKLLIHDLIQFRLDSVCGGFRAESAKPKIVVEKRRD
jgi:hypothetical protein